MNETGILVDLAVYALVAYFFFVFFVTTVADRATSDPKRTTCRGLVSVNAWKRASFDTPLTGFFRSPTKIFAYGVCEVWKVS